MKKVMFLAITLVALVCTSCTKTDTKGYYSYSPIMNIHGPGNNTTELDDALRPKLGKTMQLTKSEARAEWNSFMSSVSNINVTLNDSSYYSVKFCRREEKDGQFVNVETIGEHTWGHAPAN